MDQIWSVRNDWEDRRLFIPENEGRWDNSQQLCKRLLQEGEGHVSLWIGQGIRSLKTSKGDLELWDREGLGLIAGRRGRVGSPRMEVWRTNVSRRA